MTARVILLVLGLPLVVFASLAILVERLAGPRWLAPLWTAALGLFLTVLVLRVGAHPVAAARLAVIGGPRGLFLGGGILYGIPFALGALAAWRVGAQRPRRHPAWLQGLAVSAALLVGIVVAAVVAVATEAWWAT